MADSSAATPPSPTDGGKPGTPLPGPPPSTPPGTPPATPPGPPPEPKAPPAPKGPKGEHDQATFTAEQVREAIAQAVADHVGSIRAELTREVTEAVAGPIRRQGKLDAFKDAHQAYIRPADLDRSDPDNPCIFELLENYDDTRVVREAKRGGKTVQLTQLDLELERFANEIKRRKPRREGDELGTPPVEGDAEFYRAIREQAKQSSTQAPVLMSDLEKRLGLLPSAAAR